MLPEASACYGRLSGKPGELTLTGGKANTAPELGQASSPEPGRRRPSSKSRSVALAILMCGTVKARRSRFLPPADTGSWLADLYDDANAVRAAVDKAGRDVVLCGHSYAGMVITQAAAGPHPAVRHLVYLAAAIPDAGDSLATLAEASTADRAQPEGESEYEDVDVRTDGRARTSAQVSTDLSGWQAAVTAMRRRPRLAACER